MKSKLTQIAADQNTPEATLADVLRAIQEGRLRCDKLLVLTLDTQAGEYEIGYSASNMTASEIRYLIVKSGVAFEP